MDLEEIIIERIRQEGPISFRDYMEMCLYYPGLGFYTTPDRERIGMNGAFYTSANLTKAFGAAIARQIVTMWKTLGAREFTILEYGAGTGMLCRDILSYLEHNHAEMYHCLSYGIVERSPVMRKIEKEHLRGKVTWYDSPTEIPCFSGCVLSNELLDNFAVHPVIMKEDLMEVYVTYEDGLREIRYPARPEIRRYVEELGIRLPYGFRAEINLDMEQWLVEIARFLKQGYLMTIDYGGVSEDLYQPSKSEGTLLCYRDHGINDTFYGYVGEQDITSHVNFSALIHWGKKYGLTEHCFTDQCHFLLAMGFNELLNEIFSHEKDILKAARTAAYIRHTLLFDMGNKFKVLLQEKSAADPKR